jgi:hypothetical protein
MMAMLVLDTLPLLLDDSFVAEETVQAQGLDGRGHGQHGHNEDDDC